jgi:hypothetical protein
MSGLSFLDEDSSPSGEMGHVKRSILTSLACAVLIVLAVLLSFPLIDQIGYHVERHWSCAPYWPQPLHPRPVKCLIPLCRANETHDCRVVRVWWADMCDWTLEERIDKRAAQCTLPRLCPPLKNATDLCDPLTLHAVP